ncbi:MAG: threonine aldolase [Deltaproteobacteria bacterium RIFCSPLOWO2_02_FULL_44_10]|nr:MAG: threonine aldolase [Deltaproteobacteria bacterium RIFCSPHIGHO2_02_FULL_44_16]OGQ45733.1 MAG: threonine aldolase [Deltaproteobacteria bacterium RIFCSPLOWO2_02_FULL_44_10]
MINLYSDTQTKPTRAMLETMMDAGLGDEQLHEDPTVLQLEKMVAEILGKSAALFLPSGTMCNQIAIRVHCHPGEEIILERTYHPLIAECGGAAAIAGAMVYPLDGVRGIYTVDQLKNAIRPNFARSPRSKLVWIEQTTNMGGGAIWPIEKMRSICAIAKEHKLATHLDGARLFNASVATGMSAKEYATPFDSVWIDFTKGLGTAIGACLAGSKEFIEKAWYYKLQMGGALRQAGVVAAPCIYALNHNIKRLSEDHENAKLLAFGLSQISTLHINVDEVETNLVFFDVSKMNLTASQFVEKLAKHNVRMCVAGPTRVRAVTHLDVNKKQIEQTIVIIQKLFI